MPKKRGPIDILSLCHAYTPEGVRVLAAVMRDEGQPGATRVAAATALMDRAYGKPKQTTKVEGDKSSPIVVEILQHVRAAKE